MQLGSNFPLASPLAIAIFLALLLPAAATAAAPARDGEKLAPPLEELANPVVANSSPAAQADRLGVPADGPGSLVRQGERVLLTARFERGVIAALPQLREAGAGIVSASRRTQTVTLAVDPAQLPAIAAVAGVRAAWPLREPIVYGATGPCEGGAAISEGLGQLQVDDAREAFELRGDGITVGVLSDSYDTARLGTEVPATEARDDVLSGDLPGPAGSCAGQAGRR